MLQVNNETHSSYQQVCQVLGLLIDDGEWETLLSECEFIYNSRKLRLLFCTILLFCNISNPSALFDKHWSNWVDDFQGIDRHQNFVLIELDNYLMLFDKHTTDFGLPPPEPSTHCLNPQYSSNIYFNEEYEISKLLSAETFHLQYSKLNKNQKVFVDNIFNCCREAKNKLFFLDARGGTGKTFTLNVLLKLLRMNGYNCIPVATSGVAASLLFGGRTFHSAFKCPLVVDDNTMLQIKPQSSLASYLKTVQVIVWDEAPMASRKLLECLDRTLRDITQKELLFGGKVLVLAGDFRQVLPVIKNGTRAQIVDACIKSSPLWNYFNTFHLTENMRLQSSASSSFDSWLLALGNGELETDDNNQVVLPRNIVVPSIFGMYHAAQQELVQWTYPCLQVSTIFITGRLL